MNAVDYQTICMGSLPADEAFDVHYPSSIDVQSRGFGYIVFVGL